MIVPSLIYIAVTIILAMVDAIRIRKAKGVVENIQHWISYVLGVWGVVLAALCQYLFFHKSWPAENIPNALLYNAILFPACGCIRLVFFDLSLNLWRRMKIDYESPTTSSYVDQHTNKLGFWQKRAIGIAGWGLMVFVHYLIFNK